MVPEVAGSIPVAHPFQKADEPHQEPLEAPPRSPVWASPEVLTPPELPDILYFLQRVGVGWRPAVFGREDVTPPPASRPFFFGGVSGCLKTEVLR